MKKSKSQMVFDVILSILSIVIVVLTVIAFLNTEEHAVLLPVVFSAGSGWLVLIAGRGFYQKKRVYPILCCAAIAGLIFMAVRGFVLV